MTNGGQNKTKNRLWLARKRKGFRQKQVAYLLNHRNIDQISRYENGSRLPTLQTALKLEIIFGVPVRLMFKGLHDQLRGEIKERAETSQAFHDSLNHVFSESLCSFAELLTSPNPSPEE